MGSNIPRRHHYIPRMLLNNFCDDDCQLWVGDKFRSKIYKSHVSNVFVQRNLYATFDFASKQYSHEYDQVLGGVEQMANPVVQKIIYQARCGEFPRLSQDQEICLKRFLLSIYRRTPESQALLSSEWASLDIYYETAKIVAKNANIVPPDKSQYDQDEQLKNKISILDSNSYTRFAAGDFPAVCEIEEWFVRKTGLFIVVIQILNRKFLIGSQGVTDVKPCHESDLAQGIWFPLSHDVLVRPVNTPNRNHLFYLGRRYDSIMKRINRNTIQQSKYVASQSRHLIQSLMRSKLSDFVSK